MQRNRKELLSSALFLLGLVILLVLVSLVFKPKDNTKAAGMEDVTANGFLGEAEQTLDVLFLSDSVGYCSIIPMQIWRDYGITSYVCGTPAQPLYYSKEFLEKALTTQSPKVVVLETMPIFKEFEGKEEVKNTMERVLPIFRYHDRWKDFGTMLKQDFNLQVEYTYQDVSKGYRYSMATESVDAGNYPQTVESVANIPKECKEKVKEIKDICDDHGAKLVLVGIPNVFTWSADRYNALVLLAEELGVTYIEMNFMQEEVPIDWTTDCYDAGEHLNYLGAQKATAYLGKYLWDLDVFVDKRGDEEYASWKEAEKEFYESVVD